MFTNSVVHDDGPGTPWPLGSFMARHRRSEPIRATREAANVINNTRIPLSMSVLGYHHTIVTAKNTQKSTSVKQNQPRKHSSMPDTSLRVCTRRALKQVVHAVSSLSETTSSNTSNAQSDPR